jgi:hypothetical protein
MTEWLNTETHKPNRVTLGGHELPSQCIVCNSKRPGYIMPCEYDPARDIFIMNYDDCKRQPTLAVTHFIQIPPTPQDE